MNNPLLCTALIAMGYSLVVAAPNLAHSEERCSREISLTAQDIEGRLGAKISSLKKSVNQSSPFHDRKQSIRVRLASRTLLATPRQDRAGAAIINSDALMKVYAQRVMSRCDDVAEVIFSFYEDNAGWLIHPDRQVAKIKCVTAGSNQYAWGEMPCL